MSKRKTKDELKFHKKKSLKKLDAYIDSLIDDPEIRINGKADKLCYWISDYARLLKKEKTFNPEKSIRYHRGDIVKIHLGYRIGNEEGGLHFGIVLDNNNSKKSGTLTIIPLTSVKSNKKVHPNSVLLGTELFRLIISKHDKLASYISGELKAIRERMKEVKDEDIEDYLLSLEQADYDALNRQCEKLISKQKELEDIRNSIMKMKDGSIALVNQITTISKIRVYDPTYSQSVLYGIRLSDSSLDLIDEKIKEMFTKSQK